MGLELATTDDIKQGFAALAAEIAALRAELAAPRKEWLTVSEYADHVGKTPRTIRRWIDQGKLETKTSGNVVLVKV